MRYSLSKSIHDVNIATVFLIVISIIKIVNRHFRFKFKDFGCLLQYGFQGISIAGMSKIFFRSSTIRFAWAEVTKFPFDSECKVLMRLIFADTFHLPFINGIKLLLIAFLLTQKTFAKFKQFLQFQFCGDHFPFCILKNPSLKIFQLLRRISRQHKLIGFSIIALAAQNLFRLIRKFAAIINTVFTCGFYQTLTQTILKPDLCWIAYGSFRNDAGQHSPKHDKIPQSPVSRRSSSIFSYRSGNFFAPAQHHRRIGRIFPLK